jgi:hypothetical protein
VRAHLGAATLFGAAATEVIPAAGLEAWQADREDDLLRARTALDRAPRDPDRLNGLGLSPSPKSAVRARRANGLSKG